MLGGVKAWKLEGIKAWKHKGLEARRPEGLDAGIPEAGMQASSSKISWLEAASCKKI
jgi:hypothetical protein